MKFSFFHLMPYTARTDYGPDWPVPNKFYDPEIGAGLYDAYIDTLAYAEACGFDWIGCNEHHMSPYGLMANPNLIAAALSQRLKRAHVLMAGNLVPLLNPLRVAEEYAMLDSLLKGRFIGGILRGIPHEYVAYNTPPDESHARLEEALRFMKRAWTSEEPFGWEGEFYQYRAVSIWPRPVQRPMPRILMSCSNEAAVINAARHRAKFGMTTIPSVERANELIKLYRETARETGWEPQDEDVLVGTICLVGDTDKEAIETLEAGRKYFAETLSGGVRTAQRIVMQKSRYNAAQTRFQDIREIFSTKVEDEVRKGVMLCGSADSVAEQAEALFRKVDMGVLNVNMKVGDIPDETIRHSMTLFGQKIIPQVRDVRARAAA